MGFRCLYVKVGMDGAPYLRKVELKIYHSPTCQYGSHGVPMREGLIKSRLMDLLHGLEYG
ncbi:putative transcription regulator AUX/IAA family [Helianthus annuus]|nr:putative transcription regulator AUX/IAA family [Helianthus annuus]